MNESFGKSIFGYTHSYRLRNVALGEWGDASAGHLRSNFPGPVPGSLSCELESAPLAENAVFPETFGPTVAAAVVRSTSPGRRSAGANRLGLAGDLRRDGKIDRKTFVGHGHDQSRRSIVASTLAERLTLLQNCTLLGSLPEDVQVRIAGFAHDRMYRDGKTIFRKGEPGNSMMLVMRGRVRICVLSPDGKEVTFSIIDCGKVFGEVALVDGKSRSANAVAFGDTHLLVIERRAFIPFLESNPRTTLQLLLLMCERARNASEITEDVAFFDVPVRLARLFLKLGGSHGTQTAEGTRIDLRLSQRDLGNLVATSRETINKLLRQWQREGLLETADGTVTIRDFQAIEVLANL